MADEAGNGEYARDAKGHFLKGNKGGPGYPGAARVFEFRKAIQDAVEPEVAAGIIRKAAAMALGGNIEAMRLVLERLVGRPTEHVIVEGDLKHTVSTIQAGLEKISRRFGEVSLGPEGRN